MKHLISILISIFFSFLLLTGPVFCNDTITAESSGQKSNILTARVKNLSYISYSTIKQSFPFIIGYPSFNSNAIGLDINYNFTTKKLNHNLDINVILPSKITSDNGTGKNFLVNVAESKYNRIEARYYFYDDLWSIYDFEFKYGFTSSALYENRKMTFLSEDIIRQEDVNIGLGPTLSLDYKLGNYFKLNAEGHILIFLPYTCYGSYSFETTDGNNRKDNYYPITYKTLWQVFLTAKTNDYLYINAGYRRTNQIGYGNSKNSIILSNIITSKMDRINEIFIGVSISL